MLNIEVNLPELSSEYPVTSENIRQFQEQGHILLRGVVSQVEIDAYRPNILKAMQRNLEENHAIEKLVKGNQENWIYINNLWSLDEITRRFILASRFGQIAAQLLGVDAVRLFRDQTYFKKPGGTDTPWHQDGYFMPLDTDKIITMWLPLVDVTPEMAPMSFVTGSHRGAKYLGTSTPQPEKMQEFAQSIIQRGYEITSYGSLGAGDVTFHSGWTLHSAPTNKSDRTREVLVIVYYADGARIAQPKQLDSQAPLPERFAEQMRQQTQNSCFPGLKPGDLAVTPMNPLIYRKNT
ncbi:putative phytanoyl-CoA dioxygenase [Nostoc sp. NIES-4103]|nr:putative phytanoyl-CoA dioxygenase [Nostoc sp. NIES-4103]